MMNSATIWEYQEAERGADDAYVVRIYKSGDFYGYQVGMAIVRDGEFDGFENGPTIGDYLTSDAALISGHHRAKGKLKNAKINAYAGAVTSALDAIPEEVKKAEKSEMDRIYEIDTVVINVIEKLEDLLEKHGDSKRPPRIS